jgi:hypothetical protein
MRAFLRLFAIVATCTAIALISLDWVYSYALSRHPMLRIPRDRHYGNLVIGDSRVSSLLEGALDSITGSPWIVIPHYGGNADDIRIALSHFFMEGNRADTVWISTDMRLFGNTGIRYEWLYYAHESRHSGFLQPRIPFRMYALNNASVGPRRIITDLTRDVDRSRTEVRDFSIVQWYEPHMDQQRDYSSQQFRYGLLDSIQTLLRRHGVRHFGFFTAPLSPDFFKYQRHEVSYKDSLRGMSDLYVDFSRTFTDTAYFADLVHLKRRFFLPFTRIFADSLRIHISNARSNKTAMSKIPPMAISQSDDDPSIGLISYTSPATPHFGHKPGHRNLHDSTHSRNGMAEFRVH